MRPFAVVNTESDHGPSLRELTQIRDQRQLNFFCEVNDLGPLGREDRLDDNGLSAVSLNGLKSKFVDGTRAIEQANHKI